MNREKIIIFGAGKIGRRVVRMMKYDKEILYVVDNDSQKWGGYNRGLQNLSC